MNETVIARTVTNQGTLPDRQGLDAFLGAPATPPWYRRPAYLAAAAGLLVLILLLSRCFAGEAPGGYATEKVRRGDLTVTVSATGNLQPTNQVEVGSEQSGLVTQVFVDNNDRVVQGQPLARLDTSRLQDTITQARAGLASADAQVATALASAAQAQATLARQEEVYRLSGGRVPSGTELDAARAEARRAAAGVRAAQAQVAQARAALSSAETNLSKATIYSPVTGVVLSRQVDPGQTVAASFQAPVLFTIAEDLSAMDLEVRVDEADVGQVHEGQRATFNVDAYPGRAFPAVVTRVDVGANASGTGTTGSGTAASTTAGSVVAYTARLSVQNPQLVLRPGMTATAEIVTNERRNVLLVPNAALRYSPERDEARNQKGGITSVLVPRRGRRGFGGQPERQATIGRGSRQTVHVLGADGTPQPVQVVVGATNGSETEIIGGDLRAGQDVITARLAAGQTQEKSGAGQRGGRRDRSGASQGGSPPAQGGAPATAAPARGSEPAPPANAAQPSAARAPGAAPTAPQSGRADPPRLRDMTPEQRRAYLRNLAPEQRAALRERRRQRLEAEGAQPEATPSDGP
jgi:HlyD family secretion protein